MNIALPDLPIREALPRLALTLREGARALLCAPPGAGKSTVVPLMLLDCEWLGKAKILMLEPRRIAARAIARRMASLLGEPAGERVGYRTRLETKVSARTRIEVVTEGILTRLLQEDASLPGIGCVIFDEFHERSLNADLGLALSLDVQENLRADLKILVMSATLDATPLQALMFDAPMVQSLGRSFDVETLYVARRAEQSIEQHTAQTIRRALGERPGDVLCFLPGAREIRRVSDLLATTLQDGSVNVLPLYGELSSAAQDAALDPAPAGHRKVVLATSIAETSLTIEGVRIVVDAGLQRSMEFDPATGMSRLTTGKVSQAASDQRRGRAGRLAHGVCYRLWAAGAQATLAAHTPAEITRADLAPLALELKCWGSSDAAELRWLDPPPAAPLAQAHDLLRSLEAIDSAGRVTPHGRALARVGAHPRLAHMLVKASRIGAGRLAADIAAVLSERDILRRGAATGDADLRLRIAVLRGNRHDLPSGMSVDARALQQAKSVSALWQRGIARGADEADPHLFTGVLLALAYPDRIASARGQTGRFLLANGRGAAFASADALARSEFIVAAELDDAEREARIFLAAPISLADIEKNFDALIATQEQVRWDSREQAVIARRERRLGAITLARETLVDAEPELVTAAVIEGLRTAGIEALPWSAELRQWQARVSLLRAHKVACSESWPDISDAALLASLDVWAPAWLIGITRRDHFSRIDLGAALRCMLSYEQQQILEREAPTHVDVPSGSRIRIDYLDGDTPSLSARLQEMFGQTRTPTVAAGRVAIVLKLLSPAGRPVQVTRDLQSFWNKGYHEVKKDLKGRYPKHFWPDDPLTAAATRRVRPRR